MKIELSPQERAITRQAIRIAISSSLYPDKSHYENDEEYIVDKKEADKLHKSLVDLLHRLEKADGVTSQPDFVV